MIARKESREDSVLKTRSVDESHVLKELLVGKSSLRNSVGATERQSSKIFTVIVRETSKDVHFNFMLTTEVIYKVKC